MYNTYGQENTDDDGDDTKVTHIWLSGIIAVVDTSLRLEALRDLLLYRLDVVYIQISKYPSFGMTITSPSCICIDARAWYHSFFHG